MDLGLRDRVYIITGGSRGLGRAAARALVADGARVVLGARDPAGLARAVAELGPDQAAGVTADNASPDAADRLIAAARDRFGRLDGALISVGGPPGGSVAATPDDAWRRAFESVFLGAVRIGRGVGAVLGEGVGAVLGEGVGPVLGDGGSIAFVLSTSVRVPIADLAISNGLRPGLAGVVKMLADELGPAGIRVNGLLPGRIGTGRVREIDARAGDPDQVRAELSERIPLRRYGEPEEFGRVAAFLLSPAASYVTGSMIPVEGGALRAI
jgi:3-oxoacyl-[acyl-carrier protein] reductase